MKDLKEYYEKIKYSQLVYIEIKDKDENTNKNGGEEKEELEYEGVTNEKEFIKQEKTDLKKISNF